MKISLRRGASRAAADDFITAGRFSAVPLCAAAADAYFSRLRLGLMRSMMARLRCRAGAG